jgi:gluconate 2-dehydrogenase gamma chain
MARRREALKIIGAISATCAFPFASTELYGQHQHPAPGKQAEPEGTPYFSAADGALVSRIAELIIPETSTPGAVGAGVPGYIDFVVRGEPQHQKVFAAGLEYLRGESQRKHRKDFLALSEKQQVAILQPLSDAVDAGNLKGPGATFFRAMKSMTADGYFTSRAGMVEELGFEGGSVLSEFPVCDIPEH